MQLEIANLSNTIAIGKNLYLIKKTVQIEAAYKCKYNCDYCKECFEMKMTSTLISFTKLRF